MRAFCRNCVTSHQQLEWHYFKQTILLSFSVQKNNYIAVQVMSSQLLAVLMLYSLQRLATIEGLLEVQPYLLLVSENGTLKQDRQDDSSMQFHSEGFNNDTLLYCLQIFPGGQSSRPQDEVIWMQNGKTINTAGAKYRKYGRKRWLLIRSLTYEDSGVYECAMSSNITHKGRAELWVAPEIIAASERQTLRIGSDRMTVTCLVTGGLRTVEWRKDNDALISSDSSNVHPRYKVLASGSLEIANVSTSDGGVYTCRVSNKAGAKTRQIKVEIRQKVQSTEDGCIVQQEPEEEFTADATDSNPISNENLFFVQKPPSCVQTSVGFTITLRCSASTGGSTKPAITWLKGKKRSSVVQESSDYLLLPDGSLKIRNVKKSDRGIYICKASSGHKNESTAVQFRVVTLEDVCGTVLEEEQEVSLVERVRRVVGGEPSHIRYWPWQILLQYNPTFLRTLTFLFEEPLCGGALIQPNWVVTAAHCVHSSRPSVGSLSPDKIMLRAGVYNRSDSSETYQQSLEVEQIIKHPQYLLSNGLVNIHFDIALLKLAHPVKPTSHVGFICLPKSSGSEPRPGTLCTVTGWGHKEFQAGVSSELLHSAQVPVVSRSQCTSEKAYSSNYITRNSLCAGWRQGGADACQNDSGGPLVCQNDDNRWILHGVVNRGVGCGSPHKYGIYARVSRFVQWINSVVS